MKRDSAPESSIGKQIAALTCSILIVGAAFIFMLCGDAVIDKLAEFGLDFSKIGFIAAHDVEPGKLELHFIDVGQGDAILARSSEYTMLVDSGTSESEEKLCAYIRSLGIRRIDCFVLTHPHDDHIGGAAGILDNFKVGRIIMSDTDEKSSRLDELYTLAQAKKIEIDEPTIGALYLLGDLKFIPLAPLTDVGENNASLVLRLEFGATAFLLAADAEYESELLMLERYGGAERYLLDCDLLKLGHHGSSTSSSRELLSAVTPDWTVISCAYDNPFGHPHREVLELLAELGIDDEHILRTDKHGSVVFSTDGKEIELIS